VGAGCVQIGWPLLSPRCGQIQVQIQTQTQTQKAGSRRYALPPLPRVLTRVHAEVAGLNAPPPPYPLTNFAIPPNFLPLLTRLFCPYHILSMRHLLVPNSRTYTPVSKQDLV
jgi:hypothetical protein